MGRINDFVQISKPRIILLLLVVAWAAMSVASPSGVPALTPFIAVTIAGITSTAASGAWNHVLERHRDAKMGRTADRPVASGRLSPTLATAYGAIMAVISIASLVVVQLWLAAALTAGAIFYYTLVYTVLLKPTTEQNIVIGGLAGSFPAVIGWAAITGTIGLPAILLAALVFLWTPAHFWSLALLYQKDYASAGYPMMPNTRGEAYTRRLIIVYSVLTFGASLLLLPFSPASWIYLIAALALGVLLTQKSIGLTKEPSPKKYRSFFLFTIQYLGVLLLALIADRLLLAS